MVWELLILHLILYCLLSYGPEYEHIKEHPMPLQRVHMNMKSVQENLHPKRKKIFRNK